MLNERFLNLNFGAETIILRIISISIQKNRIEFGLEQHQIDGCVIMSLVLSQSANNEYLAELKYSNHEQRICYRRFKEFRHEFS